MSANNSHSYPDRSPPPRAPTLAAGPLAAAMQGESVWPSCRRTRVPLTALCRRSLLSSRRHTDIRLQQRNGRKTLTTVQGLNTYLERAKIEKLIKIFKKVGPTTTRQSALPGRPAVLMTVDDGRAHAWTTFGGRRQDFCCNGTIVDHNEWGEVIQLQGDHRVRISEMLAEEGIVKKENIKVHGF